VARTVATTRVRSLLGFNSGATDWWSQPLYCLQLWRSMS